MLILMMVLYFFTIILIIIKYGRPASSFFDFGKVLRLECGSKLNSVKLKEYQTDQTVQNLVRKCGILFETPSF